MLIKTSKHNITKITNSGKLDQLSLLFDMFKSDVQTYINSIITGQLPLRTNLSSKLLPTYKLSHSKWKRTAYGHASSIIRSQSKKAKAKRYYTYKKVYAYMAERHPESKFAKTKFSKLNLTPVHLTKYFKKPSLINLDINLTNELFNIKIGKHFDNFVKITLPYFNKKGTRALNIKVPLKQHKHSNSLLDSGYTLRNNINIKQIDGKLIISLIWGKPKPDIITNGNVLGIDLGYKKLLATSTGAIIGSEMLVIYNKISSCKQGSTRYKKLLIKRTQLTNFYLKQLNLSGVNNLVIENLKNLKKNTKGKMHHKVMNKLQRWSYTQCIDYIERTCMEKSIKLVKVSPAYTSQTCSSCGHIDRNSRKGEKYQCVSCGYENDADINAAINIRNLGVYSLQNAKS